MKVETYEATVENGQIDFSDPVQLPERSKVYVVVPNATGQTRHRIVSPRLANPTQAANFVKDVAIENSHAGV